jgi:hypothetical protein
MAAQANAIKIMRNRLEPVKQQLERERQAVADKPVSCGMIAYALRERLDIIVGVRIAALHALCDAWQPAQNFRPVLEAIARDSEDYAPSMDLILKERGGKEAAEEALAILRQPLPCEGEWKLDVRLDWPWGPRSWNNIRDYSRHSEPQAYQAHMLRCFVRAPRRNATAEKPAIQIGYRDTGEC